MIDYGALENELVTKLNERFAEEGAKDKLIAAPFSEYTGQHEELMQNGKVGIVFVQWGGGDYEELSSAPAQDETVLVDFIFVNPDLRSEVGLYRQIRIVKAALLGYEPEDCSERMTIKGYKEKEFEQNKIQRTLTMKTKTVAVTEYQENDTVVGGKFTKYNSLP